MLDTEFWAMLFSAICEVGVLWLFLEAFLKRRYKPFALYVGAFVALLVVNLALSLVLRGSSILTYALLAAELVVIFLLYRGKIFHILFVYGLYWAYFLICDIVTFLVVSCITGKSASSVIDTESYILVITLGSHIIPVAIVLLILLRRRGMELTIPVRHLILLLAIVYLNVIMSMAVAVPSMESEDPATMGQAFVCVGLLVLSVLMFFLFEKFQHFSNVEAQGRVLEQQIGENNRLFSQMTAHEQEMRALKHDFVNHMSIIRHLAQNQNYKELEAYATRYVGELQTVIADSVTGHPVVDAVIAVKKGLAEQDNIGFQSEARGVAHVEITPVHLATILGNLLNNAIEACDKLSKNDTRTIALSANLDGDYLYVQVVNTSPPVKIDEDGLPRSTKGDSRRHGLGLLTTRRLVEAYHGIIHCSYEGGLFTTAARLRNEAFRGFGGDRRAWQQWSWLPKF